jgi:gluconolactonase
VALPDGLAFDAAGNLHIACYEPSQMLRVTPDGTVVCLIRGEEVHLLCHPTNLAFRDNVQFTTNLGR